MLAARSSHLVVPTAMLALTVACAADRPVAPTDAGPSAARAAGRVTHRPITDFVATQGTFCQPGTCPPLLTPFPAFVTWTAPAQDRAAFVDYAGIVARYVAAASGGTIDVTPQYRGTVTERLLDDGRVEVHVNLRVSGALAAAALGMNTGFAQSSLIFGNEYEAVLAGAEPALADVHLVATFVTTTAGAPLPDLVQILFAPEPGQALLRFQFHATATGPLHPTFGVAEDTRGRLTVQQVGILRTSAPSKALDPFPVELVNVQALGSR